MAAAVLIGAALTLFVSVLPLVHFAYDNAALHLALETAGGLIAGLLAYLAVQRYRATHRLQDVALAWVFSVLAFVNLVLSAGPLVAEGGRRGAWLTWAALGFRLVASAALCGGAYTAGRPAPPERALLYAVAGATAAAVLTVGLGAWAASTWLAEPVNPTLSPRVGARQWLVGHPVVLAIELLTLGLYAGAAARFTRHAKKQGDELLRWVGAGAALGAFARLNFLLYPSLYSNFVYTGDLLRLGSYLFFLIGAAREIRAYWENQASLAALEERRRMARDLHDGLAQELAFIRSQTAAMAAGMTVPGMIEHLSAAAERAVVESRRAVEVLSGDAPEGEPLAQALVRAAEEVAGRAGARVEIETEGAPDVSPAMREALVRVTREATTNAVRHGGARKVSLRLSASEGRLRLTVADDGRGFDPDNVRHGYGLRSMCDRVEALGGSLRMSSAPGRGAVLEAEVLRKPAG